MIWFTLNEPINEHKLAYKWILCVYMCRYHHQFNSFSPFTSYMLFASFLQITHSAKIYKAHTLYQALYLKPEI